MTRTTLILLMTSLSLLATNCGVNSPRLTLEDALQSHNWATDEETFWKKHPHLWPEYEALYWRFANE